MSSKSTPPKNDNVTNDRTAEKPGAADREPSTDSGSSASEPKGDTASSPGHAPPTQDPEDI